MSEKWTAGDRIQCAEGLEKENAVLKKLVRELLDEFLDETTRNLIITNRPEVKAILKEEEGGR